MTRPSTSTIPMILMTAFAALAAFLFFRQGSVTGDAGKDAIHPTTIEGRDLEHLATEVSRLRVAMEGLEAILRAPSAPAFERQSHSTDHPLALEERGNPSTRGAAPLKEVSAEILRKPDAERRKRLSEIAALPEEVRHRAHMFWTLDQILEKYGPPDSIVVQGEGILGLLYEAPDAQWNIQTVGGMVVNVDMTERH